MYSLPFVCARGSPAIALVLLQLLIPPEVTFSVWSEHDKTLLFNSDHHFQAIYLDTLENYKWILNFAIF
jgi:hypothetical protein